MTGLSKFFYNLTKKIYEDDFECIEAKSENLESQVSCSTEAIVGYTILDFYFLPKAGKYINGLSVSQPVCHIKL